MEPSSFQENVRLCGLRAIIGVVYNVPQMSKKIDSESSDVNDAHTKELRAKLTWPCIAIGRVGCELEEGARQAELMIVDAEWQVAMRRPVFTFSGRWRR